MNERAPVPCPEMVDIRARIDALDTELVMLLAQRQQLIEAAGKVKPHVKVFAMTHGLKRLSSSF